jgi:hypothetical protein
MSGYTETPGSVAYEAYRESAGGRSLVSGDPLPQFDELPAQIRAAWDAAAQAVKLRYGAIY